eukprot:gene25202-10843_t
MYCVDVQVGTAAQAVQVAERTFSLPASTLDLIKRKPLEYKLQVACLQLDDTVPFRVHWPLNADLSVNSMQYRPYSRSRALKIGANQRDEAANINLLVKAVNNRLSIQCADGRLFVLMLQLSKKRTPAEVAALMKAPPSLEAALTAVKQQHGGGDDDDIEMGNAVQSLRCPLTGSRMKIPVKFSDVKGVACFDLDGFLSLVERSRKWQCPHSMLDFCVENLQVDSYTRCILHHLQKHSDINELQCIMQQLQKHSGIKELQILTASYTSANPYINILTYIISLLCSMLNSCVENLQVETYTRCILHQLQNRSDVYEVEISPDGRWRPAGGDVSWEDVLPQPASGIKAEMLSSDDDNSDHEGQPGPSRPAAKRGRAVSPDIILLDSSDDEGQGATSPPLKRTQAPEANNAALSHPALQRQLKPSSALRRFVESDEGGGAGGAAHNPNAGGSGMPHPDALRLFLETAEGGRLLATEEGVRYRAFAENAGPGGAGPPPSCSLRGLVELYKGGGVAQSARSGGGGLPSSSALLRYVDSYERAGGAGNACPGDAELPPSTTVRESLLPDERGGGEWRAGDARPGEGGPPPPSALRRFESDEGGGGSVNALPGGGGQSSSSALREFFLSDDRGGEDGGAEDAWPWRGGQKPTAVANPERGVCVPPLPQPHPPHQHTQQLAGPTVQHSGTAPAGEDDHNLDHQHGVAPASGAGEHNHNLNQQHGTAGASGAGEHNHNLNHQHGTAVASGAGELNHNLNHQHGTAGAGGAGEHNHYLDQQQQQHPRQTDVAPVPGNFKIRLKIPSLHRAAVSPPRPPNDGEGFAQEPSSVDNKARTDSLPMVFQKLVDAAIAARASPQPGEGGGGSRGHLSSPTGGGRDPQGTSAFSAFHSLHCLQQHSPQANGGGGVGRAASAMPPASDDVVDLVSDED